MEMASIDTANRHISDRKEGGRKLSYRVPGTSRAEMLPYLKTHNLIIKHFDRETVDIKLLQRYVIAYTEAQNEGTKRLILNKMVLESSLILLGHRAINPAGDKDETKNTPIEKLLDMWLAEKRANLPKLPSGQEKKREKRMRTFERWHETLAAFFKENKVSYGSNLSSGLDIRYIEWRSEKKFDGRYTPTADATIKKELQALQRIATLAAREGCIKNAGIFDAKVKRGVKRVVNAYSRAEQKEILSLLEHNPGYHDTALFLLVSGLRLGEIEYVSWDGGSKIKVAGTKTENAEREIPATETLKELWRRGNIFKTNLISFQGVLKKLRKKLGSEDSIGAHRFRHSFVVNKLRAGVPFAYVREWAGHGDPGFTIKRYGKFLPKDSNGKFDEELETAKEHLDWLENDYFE
jgi:integrase